MKIIVSSAGFASIIKKAIDIDCHCINYSKGSISFETKKYQEDFEMSVICQTNAQEIHKFNTLKMIRLMDFLNQLPEQPLNIDIEPDEIKVYNFIKTFRL